MVKDTIHVLATSALGLTGINAIPAIQGGQDEPVLVIIKAIGSLLVAAVTLWKLKRQRK